MPPAITSSLLLLLLLLQSALLLLQPALAQDTTGQRMDHAPGYTFGSNVEGYLRLSTDICDIKAAIGTSQNPTYTEARKIWMDGKNSRKADGSIRTLRELATKSYAGEPVFDLYTQYFRTAAFLDQPISFAFAGDEPYKTVGQRNETIVKGLESQLQTVYLLHELDEAAQKMQDGKLSAKDGAPHNIDETWAIYTGLTPSCSLWGAANRRAAEFGTMLDCSTSRVNAAMTTAHRRLYEAAAAGNLPAFEQQKQEVIRQFLISNIQSTLKYTELMDKASAENDLQTMQTEQAEGAMFFRTIEPFVAQANNESTATVSRILKPGNPIPPNAMAIVKPALEDTYADLGINRTDIGVYGSKQSLGCPTASSAAVPRASTATSLVVVVLSLLVVLLGDLAV